MMGVWMLLRSIRHVLLAFMLSLLFVLAGCTSDDGGQVLSGVLQGIGQGLSGL